MKAARKHTIDFTTNCVAEQGFKTWLLQLIWVMIRFLQLEQQLLGYILITWYSLRWFWEHVNSRKANIKTWWFPRLLFYLQYQCFMWRDTSICGFAVDISVLRELVINTTAYLAWKMKPVFFDKCLNMSTTSSNVFRSPRIFHHWLLLTLRNLTFQWKYAHQFVVLFLLVVELTKLYQSSQVIDVSIL